MIRFLSLLLAAGLIAGLYWVTSSGVIEKSFAEHEGARDCLHLKNVRIKVYDDTGRRYMTIIGRDDVLVHKDKKLMTMRPIKVIDERTTHISVLTADSGERRSLRKVEQIEFQGNVLFKRDDGVRLKTERLLFYPSENTIETPVRCRLTTTDTMAVGDMLQHMTTEGKGELRGNVEIVRQSTASGNGATVEPVHITGDVCSFVTREGLYSVRGDVRIVRGDFILTSHEVHFRKNSDLAQARGSVAATDPDVILTCKELDYDLARNEVKATGEPKAARSMYRVPSDPSTMEYTELHAETLFYRRNLGILDADSNVRVVRFILDGDRLNRDFDIRSDHLHVVYSAKSKSKGRSNFEGHVRIESDKVGAVGDRAVFYEKSRNFYVMGHARAWSYTQDGERTNEISGGKILHDGKRGRNIVLQGVTGTFKEGQG